MNREITAEEINQTIQHIHIYGYGILRSVLLPETVATIKETLYACYDKLAGAQYGGVPDRDKKDKIIYNLQNKHRLFIDILTLKPLQEILMRFLNDPHYRFLPPETPNYILSYYNARSSGNHLDLHIDSHMPAPGDRTWVMQTVYVINEFTDTNGPTLVVPGSHRSGQFTDRSLPESAMTALLAKPGDVVFWDSRLWHGTRANTENADRWGLIATFASWWVKQFMDIPRGMNEDIYQQLSDEQKRLLGFCSIPPKNEFERVNTKCGYDFLKPSVSDYYA